MILITAANKRAILRSHQDLSWIYLGSPAGEVVCEEYLTSSKRQFIAEELDAIADVYRDDFVEYIGALAAQQPDIVLWYSTRVASKSVSQTSIFHQYIYLKFIELLATSYKEDVLFVTDNDELLANVNFLSLNNIKVLSTGAAPGRLPQQVKGVIKFIKYFMLWAASRGINRDHIKQFDVLLHSWIDERVYSRLPVFNDSYLKNLDRKLTEAGARAGRVAPLNLKFSDVFKLRQHFKELILPISFLSLADLWKAANTKIEQFSGLGNEKILGHLVNNEIEKENDSKVFCDYWLSFKAYQKLKTYLKREAVIVYPFENQPWEKMLNLALPEFRRVAYQHTTIAKNWLDYRYTKTEPAAILPNVLLSCGQIWTDFLKRYFTSIPIEDAGAVRLEYVFNHKPLPAPKKMIAVALPIHQSLAVSLQKNILSAMDMITSLGYRVKIKSHPHLRSVALLKKEFAAYKNSAFVEQSVTDLLNECDVLISCDSNVLFESVFLGRKTVCFVAETLGFGLEDWLKNEAVKVNQEHFVTMLKDVLKGTNPAPANPQKYFSLPQYEVWLKHIWPEKSPLVNKELVMEKM